MRIQEIAHLIDASLLSTGRDYEISILNFDSRKSSGNSNELFVALKGLKNDGHNFLGALYQQGIRNFLVSEAIDPKKFPKCNILRVPDPLGALQILASEHRKKFNIPVVGITGSNGKTIVKEWLSTILEQQWQVIKSPKSYNSQLGVPLSVWQINDTHDVAVFEAGISREGEMANLEKIISPSIGIFTNIGAAHAEGFESIRKKIQEKALLFKNAKQVICRKSHQEIIDTLKAIKPLKVITWDIDDPNADLNFIERNKTFEVNYRGQKISYSLSLDNQYDLENIFHTVVAALILEENPESIQQGISKIKAVPMRLELKRGINDSYILDDSYNNDVLGLSTALDYLLQQPHKTRKTVILSDILQSGKSKEKLYKEVNELLKKHEIAKLIGVGPEISSQEHVFETEKQFFPSTEALLKSIPDFRDEIILIKGARDYNLDKVARYLEEKSHGTVLEVNFEAITHNLNRYKNRLNPQTKLMVMVKAFAYGVGVNEIAHLLQYHQVDYLGVAYLDEAIDLRKKGIKLPIMIMNPDVRSFSLLETFELEPEIYSLSMLKQFLEDTQNPPPIHLKIETGMHRLGFEEEDLPELLSILKTNPQLKVNGIFTHFSSSDDKYEDEYTQKQAETFKELSQKIVKVLTGKPLLHALNSSGIARWPQFQFDMVRLGIGLYGYDSSGTMNDLRPISILKTRVSQIKNIRKGDTIGYSRKGIAQKDGRIAIIAIGYADGYLRIFSNGNAYVSINGQRAQTIGNVCMDMTMIDVTGLNVQEGDEVIIFGEDPSIADLARWANTIPYEILTNVSQRVKRVFVSE